MMKRLPFLVFFSLLSLVVAGQNTVDTTYYHQALAKAENLLRHAPKEALSAYEHILEKAQNNNYINAVLQARQGIGQYYQNARDYEKSVAIFDSVAIQAAQNNLLPVRAKALQGKGRSLYSNSLYYSASQATIESLKISDVLKDYNGLGKSYGLLGSIYFQLENYEESKKYYAKAIDLAKTIGDTYSGFRNSYNYCNCLVEEESYPQALECLNVLSTKLKKHGEDESLFWLNSYIESARLQCEPKDEKTLKDIYDNLVLLEKQAKSGNVANFKVQLYTSFTKYHILREDIANARKYLGIWKSLIRHKDDSDYESREVLLMESKLHKLEGNHRKAMELYSLYMERRLKALKGNESNRIHELNLLYETEKKDSEIASKDLEMKFMKESAAKRQWFLIFVFSVGSVLGLFVLVFYLKHKNQLLKKAREAALQAAKAKSLFLDVMTHELRTPLSTISGSVYLLEGEKDPKIVKGFINAIKFSSDYLNKLIENTILLKALGEPTTKDSAKTAKKPAQQFNCWEFIQGIADTIVHSKNGNKVEVAIEPEVPEYLLGPELDLGRILINLVSNSDKFTQKGLIRISAQKSMSSEEKTIGITFTVSDNGQGIREEEKEKIFDAFYSGKDHKNGPHSGMGLGLSLVKALLEKHGTTPRLESRFGLGTSISFTMDFGIASKPEQQATISSKPEKVCPKGKILLVEDNKVNQHITKKIIERLGYCCDVADNGKIAVEKYREQPYFLVFMDMMMPVMDGFEATEAINNLDPYANIVALTAVSEEKYRDVFSELNIDMVISKPVKASYIKEAIEANPEKPKFRPPLKKRDTLV